MKDETGAGADRRLSGPHPNASARPDVSVLVPVTEESDPLDELYTEYSAPFRTAGLDFEFLFLVEPWAYGRTRKLAAMGKRGEPIRILEVGQNITLSSLLQTGAYHARAETVLTIPAYRRVEASVLPELVAAAASGSEVIVARRWPRRDSWFSRLQNRIFHMLLSQRGGTRVHDTACGVRAMHRDVLLSLPLYGDFHHFLPLFALREGYRVREINAPQHPNDVRSGLFSPGVYLRRLVDILGLYFLLYFTERPLRFFGMAGISVSAAGGTLLVVLFLQRMAGQPLADRPLLVLAVMLIVLGVQSVALGLIGEIIVHLHAPYRQSYRLARGEQAEPHAHDPAVELEVEELPGIANG